MHNDHKHEDGVCNCGCQQEQETTDMDVQDLLKDAENIIQLIDEDSGETFDFAIADEFDFANREYVVLVTLTDEPEYVIAAKVEDEDGMMVESLSPEEEERVYSEYSRLLAEEFGE